MCVIGQSYKSGCFVKYLNQKLSVMTLSFWTDRSGQTVQTQIRLLLEESLSRVPTVCYLHQFDKIAFRFGLFA